MKNIKSVIVTTITLTLICAVAAAALGFTNKLTADRIAEANKKAEKQAMERIVVAEIYEENTVNDAVYHIAKDANGNILGYIFTVSQNGYGGKVKVMTGIGEDGKVIAIEVVEAADETPGLGQRATDDSFQNQFKDKEVGVSVSKTGVSGNQIQALTGATITSKAVTNAVNEAFKLYETITKEGDK